LSLYDSFELLSRQRVSDVLEQRRRQLPELRLLFAALSISVKEQKHDAQAGSLLMISGTDEITGITQSKALSMEARLVCPIVIGMKSEFTVLWNTLDSPKRCCTDMIKDTDSREGFHAGLLGCHIMIDPSTCSC
jgi:hypothetical protein